MTTSDPLLQSDLLLTIDKITANCNNIVDMLKDIKPNDSDNPFSRPNSRQIYHDRLTIMLTAIDDMDHCIGDLGGDIVAE